MKKLISFLPFLCLSIALIAQTKVNFSKFDAWRQNSTTKKMEYAETFYDSGYIEVNKAAATVIVYNNRLNQKEVFQFQEFMGLEMGHYLAFGKVNSEYMFNFVPEDKLLLLKTNEVVIMQFDLTSADVLKLKLELQ
jgi:hypothetical protein